MEKETVFAQQKQSVPMSIKDVAEMTMLFCLICFPFLQIFNLPAEQWQENAFLKKCQMTAYNLWVDNLVKIALSRTASEINEFYAEIQDGCQKWLENNFWQKVAEDCAHNLRVKNIG